MVQKLVMLGVEIMAIVGFADVIGYIKNLLKKPRQMMKC